MEIIYLPSFQKSFRELSHKDKDAVLSAISLFEEDPLNPFLKNHPLQKPLSGQRAITVDDDLRITFREKGGYIEVLMLDVGDHDRVYGIQGK